MCTTRNSSVGRRARRRLKPGLMGEKGPPRTPLRSRLRFPVVRTQGDSPGVRSRARVGCRLRSPTQALLLEIPTPGERKPTGAHLLREQLIFPRAACLRLIPRLLRPFHPATGLRPTPPEAGRPERLHRSMRARARRLRQRPSNRRTIAPVSARLSGDPARSSSAPMPGVWFCAGPLSRSPTTGSPCATTSRTCTGSRAARSLRFVCVRRPGGRHDDPRAEFGSPAAPPPVRDFYSRLGQANHASCTMPWTSVNRMSRPPKRYVRRVWSKPSRCRTVACRSCMSQR